MTTYDNSDIVVTGGSIINASDLNNVLTRAPKTYVKASATSRNTTTTLTDDPELSGIALAVGTYEIELVGFFTLATTATQKIKTRWAFTGTFNGTTGIRNCIGPGSAQTAAVANATETNFNAAQMSGQDAVYDAAAASAYACIRETCAAVVVTVAGNFSVQWAQAASSGNNTTLQEGSYLRIRRLV